MKVELDMSNYTPKFDLKNSAGVDTSDVAAKVDLASLKSGVDKLDTDKLENLLNNSSSLRSKVDKLGIAKLETTPTGLSKLSDEVKNNTVKKKEYDELVKQVNAIDTCGLVKKQIIMLRLNILKIKYLILLTQLLLLVVVLKLMSLKVKYLESKGMSNKIIKHPITANHSLSPKLVLIDNSKIIVRLTESCLK